MGAEPGTAVPAPATPGTGAPDAAAAARPVDASPDGVVRISDPRAVRALTHPARVAVLERLFAGAVLTATECAAVAGLTPSAMSYHLRALERWGLIVRAEPAPDGRERPWRARGRYIEVDAETSLAGQAAEQVLVDSLLQMLRTQLRTAADLRRGSPEQAREGVGLSTGRVLLTPDEAARVGAQLLQVLHTYSERPPQEVPAGARPYHLWFSVLPSGRDGVVGGGVEAATDPGASGGDG